MKMRMSLILVPAALAGLALSGCAGTKPFEPTAKTHEVDMEYVNAVHRGTRRLPITVIWVHPPVKLIEQESAEP